MSHQSEENSKGFHIEQTHEEGHEEGWLVSYADLMTLLFGFFVIMYSISNVDRDKLEALKKMSSEQFSKIEYVNPSKNMAEDFRMTIVNLGINPDNIEVQAHLDGVKLILRGNSFFESASSNISIQGKNFIAKVAHNLSQNPDSFSEVRIEGHSDNIPIHTDRFPSNWELSTARASSVVREMIELNIPSSKISASGYADSKPLVPNLDSNRHAIPENQAQNRRVEVYIRLPLVKTAKN
ncbi:flagellar motor protein MotB [bacterium]|nr:flagellar motor protein MotB [bacterium]